MLTMMVFIVPVFVMSSVVLRVKVAVLGHGAVGKTALTQQFERKFFPKEYKTTSGLDLVVVPVPIEGTKATVELYLCDISGHEMFRDIVPRLLEDVSMFILVYDQCSRDSFEACDAYLRQLLSSNTGRKVRGTLVGNFSDLNKKEVSVEEARAWADARGLEFFETSALPPGTKAEAPFRWCAESFHKAYESRLQEIARASS